jgi:hypothetical protein
VWTQCRFLSLVYIFIAIGDPIMKRTRVVIPLSCLTQPHFCACLKPGPTFPMSYIYVVAKEICKYASFSKVGGNYSLDLKIIWSSD